MGDDAEADNDLARLGAWVAAGAGAVVMLIAAPVVMGLGWDREPSADAWIVALLTAIASVTALTLTTAARRATVVSAAIGVAAAILEVVAANVLSRWEFESGDLSDIGFGLAVLPAMLHGFASAIGFMVAWSMHRRPVRGAPQAP